MPSSTTSRSSAKQPSTFPKSYGSVEWRKIAGLRDLIAHAYFEVDPDIIWDVVASKLEPLAEGVRTIRGR